MENLSIPKNYKILYKNILSTVYNGFDDVNKLKDKLSYVDESEKIRVIMLASNLPFLLPSNSSQEKFSISLHNPIEVNAEQELKEICSNDHHF